MRMFDSYVQMRMFVCAMCIGALLAYKGIMQLFKLLVLNVKKLILNDNI